MIALLRWREPSRGTGRVFDIESSLETAWSRPLKSAKISAFRWHDLRHHFAPRLVQCGVPLNTVRDLLDHSSLGMTLRYAHLTPDQRHDAVAKLNQKPVVALTVGGLAADVALSIDFMVEREGREP